ncbi:hypothetical protein VFPPC_15542 [Pochonia chlamydosporia 170]|uniref:Uncharacterized protein n=1 Tax=Pochonia chlamydosporia 170 TaxID=1380566 RepID=A0A179FY36_METCM|nr:hypothetical protein VFPPC_15542 [Pochonia chlamydosporia 170]OAQ70148.1 hypothetical protein VFPPC_15542 [Pochonia chlamydosporia 170]
MNECKCGVRARWAKEYHMRVARRKLGPKESRESKELLLGLPSRCCMVRWLIYWFTMG